MRWLNGITDSMDMNWSKLWEIVKDRRAWQATVHGVTKSRTQLSDQTTDAVEGSVCILTLSFFKIFFLKKTKTKKNSL